MSTKQGRALYPKVAAAADALRAAEKALVAAMQEQFPVGRRVLVIHYRGSYHGFVEQVDAHRVYVSNEATGKVTGRYPLYDTNGLPSIRLLD